MESPNPTQTSTPLPNPVAGGETKHNHLQIKDLRVEIDALVQRVDRDFSKSRELALVKTKLEEAKMWAGKELGNLGQELPAEFADKASALPSPTPDSPAGGPAPGAFAQNPLPISNPDGAAIGPDHASEVTVEPVAEPITPAPETPTV